MDAYVERHLTFGEYVGADDAGKRYENAEGWTDHRIGRHIVFAHRANEYTAENFRDALHVHDYCEVLFRREGDVQYVSGDRTEDPREGSVIVIPPGELHTTRLLRSSRYERYVLYFSKVAFRGYESEWSAYLSEGSRAFAAVLTGSRRVSVEEKLARLETLLTEGGAAAEISAYALVIELLVLLGEAFGENGETSDALKEAQYLPAGVRAIRRYIEENYRTIASVEAVAAHFYYTREYVTRLFRRYYNLSPGDYLEQCRIREAEKRIASGERIMDVCFAVGYRSVSAFSSAFRRVTGKAPSAFRRGR